MVIFWVVILSRFLVPLLIPKYPLPAVISALLIDAVDQTIFQQFTSLNLENYQSYDKALDIYYLTIAYLSVLKNWTNIYAIKVARFLWYYRLVGVTLFELTYTGEGTRWLLFLFPNVFEYLFIFYELVRLRWDPAKLTKMAVLIAAAFIWIFIKLPQEYWIHIAQLDTTDLIKGKLFVEPLLDPGLIETISSNRLITGMILGTFIALIGTFIYLSTKLPKFDHGLQFKMESGEIEILEDEANRRRLPLNLINPNSIEKIVLISLISIIFANILPGVNTSSFSILIGVAILILFNILITHLIFANGGKWKNALIEFVVMGVINIGLIFLFQVLTGDLGGDLNLQGALFFSILLTLIVTLYDRFYYIRHYRDRIVEID